MSTHSKVYQHKFLSILFSDINEIDSNQKIEYSKFGVGKLMRGWSFLVNLRAVSEGIINVD